MEYVCKDPSGDTWHYANDKYIRMNGEQEKARISAEYIPDPMKLWENRAKQSDTTCTPENRPTDATFALFKHRSELNA